MKNVALKIIIFLTVSSFCLFLYGFVSGIQNVLRPEGEIIKKLNVEKEAKKPTEELSNIVTLGDSLTRGVGDEEGLGYVGRFHQQLEKEVKKPVVVSNLAVSGAETKDLLAQLENEGIQYAIKQADTIVLTIGGNDLFPGADKLDQIDLSTYESNIDGFSQDATMILDKLRVLNPTSPIYWMGLYNPFADIAQLEGGSELVLAWNSLLERKAITYKDIYIIPTFDLFQGRGKEVLSTDHFHPNAAGHQLMADRLSQKILSQSGIEEGRDK